MKDGRCQFPNGRMALSEQYFGAHIDGECAHCGESTSDPVKVTISFNLDDRGRYGEFCSLLAEFAELLSADSIINHSNAYTIEETT